MYYTEEHYLYFKLFIEEFYSEITGISSFLIQILILRALLRIQSRCAGIEVKFGHCFPSSAFYLSFVL